MGGGNRGRAAAAAVVDDVKRADFEPTRLIGLLGGRGEADSRSFDHPCLIAVDEVESGSVDWLTAVRLEPELTSWAQATTNNSPPRMTREECLKYSSFTPQHAETKGPTVTSARHIRLG